MRETRIYQCEECGKYHETKESCAECENKHVKAAEIQDMYYECGERYPKTISVKMDNGAIKLYSTLAWKEENYE